MSKANLSAPIRDGTRIGLVFIVLAGIGFVGCEHRPTKPGVKSEPQDDPWKPKVIAEAPADGKVWDEAALHTFELPHADPKMKVKHVSAQYYYSIPVRPIYKSYPIYYPGRAPKEKDDYLDWLKKQKPQLIWGEGVTPPLATEEDQIAAGKIVFESALDYDDDPFVAFITEAEANNPKWYEETGTPITSDGVLPFGRYVVTEQGLKASNMGCIMCHVRVLPNGVAVHGAQGNFPLETHTGRLFRGRVAKSKPDAILPQDQDFVINLMFAAPWMKKRDPYEQYKARTLGEMVALCESVPAGVMARHGASHYSPVQIPDLIGLKDRKYFDRTGLARHRGLDDVARYVALNQGMNLLNTYDGYIPAGFNHAVMPEPNALVPAGRYSDEQLRAVAKYLYSLKPPENPHLPKTDEEKALVTRGHDVFTRENCARCHSGPNFSNNRLTPVEGFNIPADHFEKYDVIKERVGTDSQLSLETRRGTGYYKVPSLRGVWYRGPFEHNGSIQTLEDWFDPRRQKLNYVPTGWKGPPGTKTRAVPGHEFGLDLNTEDKRALIAFLRTL